MRRVGVVVRGTVQGVGYRYCLRVVAERAGVSGWVRNRADGSVEAELEGADLDTVLAWMAEGPPGSRVTSRDVTDLPTEGTQGFEVR
ncbi:acylphosphatase [Aeromicrobium choanae]|uniref:acylphosphatase n=1 Tax=Aeromicrobium choanae TaxID=1736691 RepID=A0A1T4YRS0_9ACTN|nr:acylphosphatase [Aeromicrobium choanae]SKB04459.1 acylphosphatase [Aeromicrobium choanae]